jgi:uncharacterized protein YlxW (UPF0749 family)
VTLAERSRARQAWLTHRPSRWSGGVPLVLLLAGLLFAVSALTARGTGLRSDTADLPALVRQQARLHQARDLQVAALRAEVSRLSALQAPGNAELTAANRRGDALAPEAGAQPVTGPVVTVTLDDSSLSPSAFPDAPLDYFVVHQQDVQAVVNALWAGGAEAMMLMDQRVVSTSAVRCVGNTLILQGHVYSPPYTVQAMGNPRKLRAALARSPQVDIYKEYVDAYGLGYEVGERASETFPAFKGSLKLANAAVVGR